MPVITIARQFGAGGETVGRMLAERLGANLVDKQIVAEVARRLEVPAAEVEEHDESVGSLLNRLLTALGTASSDFSIPPEVAAWAPPYADPAFNPGKAVLHITQEVIKEAARTGNAVIVGRGAAYILRDDPSVTSVFLQASQADRLATVMSQFDLDEEAARKRMRQTDANRAAYIRQVYEHDWLHPSHYDMVLDTGRIGFEGATAAILAAVRSRPPATG